MNHNVYVVGNYFYVIDPNGKKEEFHSKNTRIRELNTDVFLISCRDGDQSYSVNLKLNQIVDQDDTPYTSEEFKTFYTNNTGNFSQPSESGGVQSVSGIPVDNSDPANVKVNIVPFSSESTIFTGSNTNSWVTRSLGVFYANRELQVSVYKVQNSRQSAGVREVGSSVPKYFPIGRGTNFFYVLADNSGDIEILSSSNQSTFEVTGTRLIM